MQILLTLIQKKGINNYTSIILLFIYLFFLRLAYQKTRKKEKQITGMFDYNCHFENSKSQPTLLGRSDINSNINSPNQETSVSINSPASITEEIIQSDLNEILSMGQVSEDYQSVKGTDIFGDELIN